MFVLDRRPHLAAKMLCDVHVRVICREVTMLLPTWYWHHLPDLREQLPYKGMSQNQPLCQQLDNSETRRWAFRYAKAIFREFEIRSGKEHGSKAKFEKLLLFAVQNDPLISLPDYDLSPRYTYLQKDLPAVHNLLPDKAVVLYRGITERSWNS